MARGLEHVLPAVRVDEVHVAVAIGLDRDHQRGRHRDARAADVSQRRLAELTGISLRTLQRIERLEVDNPPIRYLANYAIVLGCEREDLIEPEWRSGRS
jgi:DNA-binding Xre family transcriptional regulator